MPFCNLSRKLLLNVLCIYTTISSGAVYEGKRMRINEKTALLYFSARSADNKRMIFGGYEYNPWRWRLEMIDENLRGKIWFIFKRMIKIWGI